MAHSPAYDMPEFLIIDGQRNELSFSFSPLAIFTSDFLTPKKCAKNSINSAFAFPSFGKAVSLTPSNNAFKFQLSFLCVGDDMYFNNHNRACFMDFNSFSFQGRIGFLSETFEKNDEDHENKRGKINHANPGGNYPRYLVGDGVNKLIDGPD